MKSRDSSATLRPSLPIRIPAPQPQRRHSDEPTFTSYLPRSPRRAFSYATTAAHQWPSLASPEEEEADFLEGDVLRLGMSAERKQGEDKENSAVQFSSPLNQHTLRLPPRSMHSLPRIAPDEFSAEEESLYATFASLHQGQEEQKQPHSTKSDTSRTEEPRGRQLALPRTNSALSSSGWTSRSSSRSSSVRETSPDDWTRRMIKQNKVDPSVQVQEESACSPTAGAKLVPCSSSLSVAQSAASNSRRGHRKSDSAASDSLSSFTRPSSGSYFSRRYSDQAASRSTPTSPSSPSPSASQSALARHLSSAESTPPQSPSSPLTPSDDSHRLSSSSLSHLVDGMANLRHSVSLVGSSLRRAGHFGASVSDPPSPVAWSEISAIKSAFRVKQESSSGVNSWLLGLREMETGGGSRAWDPREAGDEKLGSVRGRRASRWPAVSSTHGEPAEVEVSFASGASKTFSPEGLQPAEIMQAVLLPPP